MQTLPQPSWSRCPQLHRAPSAYTRTPPLRHPARAPRAGGGLLRTRTGGEWPARPAPGRSPQISPLGPLLRPTAWSQPQGCGTGFRRPAIRQRHQQRKVAQRDRYPQPYVAARAQSSARLPSARQRRRCERARHRLIFVSFSSFLGLGVVLREICAKWRVFLRHETCKQAEARVAEGRAWAAGCGQQRAAGRLV